jgi:D-lyxose ketol-isomerase
MISKAEWRSARDRALAILQKAGIALTPHEAAHMEVADFGLGRLEQIGLEVVVYINTDRVCAKELIILPWQICPEHTHPTVADVTGKEETFRCRWGEVRLYLPGRETAPFLARLPEDRAQHFTVKHQVVLKPGEQYTLNPQTLHWFQAGPEGAVVSEFSTHNTDENDVFTDPDIQRLPVVK